MVGVCMLQRMDESRYCVKHDGGGVVRATARWVDSSAESLIGQFLSDDHYDVLVEEDCDLYAPSFGCRDTSCDGPCPSSEALEETIIFKFRRQVFTPEEQRGAYEGLVGAAQPSQNRGLAAGPKTNKLANRDWVTDRQQAILDRVITGSNGSLYGDVMDWDSLLAAAQTAPSGEGTSRGFVWLRTKITELGYTYEEFFREKLREWSVMTPQDAAIDAKRIMTTCISNTTYASSVLSGIAGFFDRYPRIPYGRATAYTKHNWAQYEQCYPFMQKLASQFQQLLPHRYAAQVACADQLDPRFRVAGTQTPFTTITVNKNFRTAAHRDAGDLSRGFSNLTVVAKDKQWSGGYLVLPEYRVAVNVRPGDLLLINNHQGIHGNTEILPPAGKTLEDMERISLVCYFREKMLDLGSWEYEEARFNFIESRRLNKSHAQWRPLWNGVSENCFSSPEWYQFLEHALGSEVLYQFHPESVPTSSLEGFF